MKLKSFSSMVFIAASTIIAGNALASNLQNFSEQSATPGIANIVSFDASGRLISDHTLGSQSSPAMQTFTEQSKTPGLANIVNINTSGQISSTHTVPIASLASAQTQAFTEQSKNGAIANVITFDGAGKILSDQKAPTALAISIAKQNTIDRPSMSLTEASLGHYTRVVEAGAKPGTQNVLVLDQDGRIVSDRTMPSAETPPMTNIAAKLNHRRAQVPQPNSQPTPKAAL